MNKVDQNDQQLVLQLLCTQLERDLFSFSMERKELLFDEEENQYCLAMLFGRGDKTFNIVINPNGSVKFYSPRTPRLLLAELHNSITLLLQQVIMTFVEGEGQL